jgi:two-component system response regulator LytT
VLKSIERHSHLRKGDAGLVAIHALLWAIDAFTALYPKKSNPSLRFKDNRIDMNVLMIEHEQEKAEKIKELLNELDDSIQVVGVTETVPKAADWLTRNKIPDLILANQQVMSQTEALAGRRIRTVVTFTTFSEEYNFAAFRYKTMKQLFKTIPQIAELRLNLSENPKTHGNFKERFLVKQGQRLLSIPVNQVAYFFSEDRFIFLKTFDNQKFLLEYRMEKLESLLSPALFFRINRSHIISLSTVKEIHAYFGNRLKLYLSPAPEKEIIVSRKRVNDFKEWLDK